MGWRVEFLNEDVARRLSAFPKNIRASFERMVDMIQEHGLERMRGPYVRHVEGRLWEMRVKSKDGLPVPPT